MQYWLDLVYKKGLHFFLHHQKKRHRLSKNAFFTGVVFNTELHPRKINLPEHQ